MFGAVTSWISNQKKLMDAADQAAKRSFSKAAFKLMQAARAKIVRSVSASSPGSPPHSRRGQLQRAIRYSADAKGAVIGPYASMVGTSATAHEFGGQFRGQNYPPRPFMQPTLNENLDTFAGAFSGSISQ